MAIAPKAYVPAPRSFPWALDERTRSILAHRGRAVRFRRRGWVVRRALFAADVVGLILAFGCAELATGQPATGRADRLTEMLVFVATLPLWIVLAKLYRLYDNDDERTSHSTVDEFVAVFHLVTVGAWCFFLGAWVTGVADPDLIKLGAFWLVGVVAVAGARAIARTTCRRSLSYIQNAVIVGAGDVGQLVARKILQHPEYGINIVGFVDDDPRGRWSGLEHVAMLGGMDCLAEVIETFDVERVIVAFSQESGEDTVARIRSLNDVEVQIDVVPRLFDLIGPSVAVHTVEGLPLLGLPPTRIARSSMFVKRLVDVVGALCGLLLTAPLWPYIAYRIKRDSDGPIFFRQVRLGHGMREFTALKFRTMRVDVDDAQHRAYIKSSMANGNAPEGQGLFKLERGDAITPFGRWLRKTSLDELPQLLNVLRGDMSLVGPRPCIPYETESFAAHHFERFLVPAGLTGLWQVTARATTTFGEALDMDVAYARSWSLGLDVQLLLRTPVQVFAGRGAA